MKKKGVGIIALPNFNKKVKKLGHLTQSDKLTKRGNKIFTVYFVKDKLFIMITSLGWGCNFL